MTERAQWWVNRVGSINTIGVAFPNVFGVWAQRLPVTTVLGFVNQAMVLVAVAREYPRHRSGTAGGTPRQRARST